MIWFLYFADILGVIKFLTGILSIFGTAYIFVRNSIAVVDGDECGVAPKMHVLAVVVCALIGILTPSAKTMWLMMGLSSTNEISESAIGEKVLSVIDKKMDHYLSEYAAQ